MSKAKYPSRTRPAQRAQYERVRNKAMALVGKACKCCGYKDKRALQIDHVKDDGYLERRGRSGVSIYYHIIHECEAGRAARYQILCANCNVIKRHEKYKKSSRPRRKRRSVKG